MKIINSRSTIRLSGMVGEMLQNSTTCTFICNKIYVQQDIFIFNILYFNSTRRIFFQLQPKRFSFNKNVCSTSTQNNFIQQKYLFNFNPNYFHSTKIILQFQPKIISFNNKVPGHSKYRHSIKFPVWSPDKYAILRIQSPITSFMK